MFERCLYFNINSLTRRINRLWDDAFADFNLSPSHAYLLRLVLSEPGISPKQISQQLKLEKSTVTRSLDSLQKKNLLSRKTNTEDAREQAIYPTLQAEKIADALEEKGHSLYLNMTKILGKEQLDSLVKQLRNIEKDFHQ